MKNTFSENSVAEVQPVAILHQSEVLGHQFQIYGTSENPMFLAKDVAGMIEHSDVSMMLRSIDDDEKLVQTMFVSGQNRDCWFLTENGLYEVLFMSRKPIAKQFKKQVKSILTEIRTKGAYVHATPEMSDDEIMARGLAAAQRTIERKNQIIAQQKEQLALQAHDVEYCNEVLSAVNLHTVDSIAHHLGISAIKLNKFLVDEDWIFKRGGIYCASAKIRGKNYADYHIIPCMTRNGETITREHLKWTEQGRRAVIELWNKRRSQEG